MFLQKNLLIFFLMGMILLFPAFSFSQSEGATLEKKDSLEVIFEKIRLDGKIAYINSATEEIITKSEYLLRFGAELTEDDHGHHHGEFDEFHDYWTSDKVNVYKGVKVPTPFKIQFDQTTFTHPVDHEIEVTSRYGRRRRRSHRGIDLDLVTGDNVRTVLPGKVRFVGYSSGHGKTVVVRHVNEIETVYAHLSEYKVEVNQIVSEGEVIGLGGNTGRSTGSHLHLEVRYKGVCIHPEYVFNFDGSQMLRGTDLWVSNSWQSPKFHSAYRKSKVKPLFTEEDAIAAQKAEPRFHRVRSGDTLGHIAMRYHLGVSEICRMNGISKRSTLRVGQRIKVR